TSSHGSPEATVSSVPSRSTPCVITRTTVPGKPASAMTMFDPPARTSTGSPAASQARTASTTSASLPASTTFAAGPPSRSVVSGASGTPVAALGGTGDSLQCLGAGDRVVQRVGQQRAQLLALDVAALDPVGRGRLDHPDPAAHRRAHQRPVA